MTGKAASRTKVVRIILGIAILIFSCALAVWGFLPTRRELRNQPISPTELQLPTPVSFHLDGAAFVMPSQPKPVLMDLVF